MSKITASTVLGVSAFEQVARVVRIDADMTGM
jgi:hypothetical protein